MKYQVVNTWLMLLIRCNILINVMINYCTTTKSDKVEIDNTAIGSPHSNNTLGSLVHNLFLSYQILLLSYLTHYATINNVKLPVDGCGQCLVLTRG